MKIAITSQGKNEDSTIDQRFGRCNYFLIFEIDGDQIKSITPVENKGAIQGHGAGILAAQQVSDLDVNAVISGDLGPKASNVLKQAGIKAYHASGNVKDAIQEFISGKLRDIADPEDIQTDTSKPHILESGVEKPEIIFFPLLEDKGINSLISEHFGHAPFFGAYDVKNQNFTVIENKLDHSDQIKSPIDQIEDLIHPTTIFAKGIGGRAITIIKQKGMSLKTGHYDTVKEVIENLDALEDQTNSCGH